MVEKTDRIQSYINSIQKSLDEMISICEGLTEEVLRFKPSEEEWSIVQVLSHVNEATPYWLGEIERVVANTGCEWGRGLQDPARLAAVADPDSLKVKDLLEGLRAQREKVAEVLGRLTEEQLTIESPHRNFAKFGNKPVSFIISHFLEEHIDGHVGQINRNLSKIK